MKSLATSVALLLTLWASAVPGIAQSPGGARLGVRGGDPTDEGTFDGTWMYVNRDAHFAMWIRTKDGKPQVRLQYQSLANPESFETDWSGTAHYYMAGDPGSFSLALEAAGPDEITANWLWELAQGEMKRTESAKVNLRRTGYGRTLAMNFKGFKRVYLQRSEGSIVDGPMTWTWIKVSKRELLWDELPW